MAPHGLLYALSRRRSGRGHRLPSQQGAARHADWRADGIDGDVLARDLGLNIGLSPEYRGTPNLFLAGIHHSGLRMDHSVGGLVGGIRNARAVQAAFALSPAVQRAELSQWRNGGQVLSVPGIARSEVRSDRVTQISRDPFSGFRGGGGVLMAAQLSASSSQPSAFGAARSFARTGVAAAGLAALLMTAGCRQDMHDQPKVIPQRGS